MKLTIQCWEPVQAHKAISTQLWPWLKSALAGGHKMIIDVRPESKTREQEEKYHAIIGEIAKQASHAGAKWDADSWKRFLVDQWAKDTGRQLGRVSISLDGERVVQLGMQTRKFSKEDGSEFIEFLLAWAANSGIELSKI